MGPQAGLTEVGRDKGDESLGHKDSKDGSPEGGECVAELGGRGGSVVGGP